MAHFGTDPDPQQHVRLRLPAAHLILRRAAAVVVAALALACAATPPLDSASPAAEPPTRQPTAAVVTPSPSAATCSDPCRGTPRAIGGFPRRAAPEASGLVAGRRNPDALYVLDDGPGTRSLLVISAADAAVLGRIQIAGFDSVDSEGLAAGPCTPDPGQCLYVGDIGDNTGSRDSITIWRVREPAAVDDTVPVAGDAISLRYPDGAHDAEALLVDGDGTIGIVTKDPGRNNRGGARLYVTDGFTDATLTDAGRVRVPFPELPIAAALVGHVVTAADWSPGGVVLRTYDAAYEYRAPDGSGGLEAFAAWPVTEIPPAPEPQGEAIAYDADGCGLLTVSEDSGTVSSIPCR